MSQQRARLAVLGAILLALAPRAARATQKFGPIQLSGNLQTANIVRTPDQNTYEYIMNRNTAHVRLDYDWLQSGKFYNKYDIPFLESSHLSIVWRGVYDSIYDTTPGFIQKEDNHGRAYGGLDLFDFAKLKGGPKFARSVLTLSGLSRRDRDALKFDNQLREAYADIKLRNIPLTVRAGRQQIVWGESDDFRMLDRANTLDLTWHFVQEIPAPAFGWDQIRRPMWMFKFLYDLGDIWKLSQNFLEWYWNPGDWFPAKQAFLPRPWGLRFYDPLTNDDRPVPAVGHVAGIYARNDINRGVFKAPANETVEGAVSLETMLNKAQQDVLNPLGVNCFRFFEGRGFKLWGALPLTFLFAAANIPMLLRHGLMKEDAMPAEPGPIE